MTILGKIRKAVAAQIVAWEAELVSVDNELAELEVRQGRLTGRRAALVEDLAQANVELATIKARIQAAGGDE